MKLERNAQIKTRVTDGWQFDKDAINRPDKEKRMEESSRGSFIHYVMYLGVVIVCLLFVLCIPAGGGGEGGVGPGERGMEWQDLSWVHLPIHHHLVPPRVHESDGRAVGLRWQVSTYILLLITRQF